MNDNPMTNGRPEIRLHIERLVVEGLDIPPAQGRAFRAAVEAELVALLTRGGVAASLTGSGLGGSVPLGHATPDLPPATVRFPGAPAAAGRQVARAVYSRIGT